MPTSITHQTYEDPEIVEGYIKRNALQPKQKEAVRTFAASLKGSKVLDLGCGPGQDSYLFAEMGCEVIGLDYSQEMISRARALRTIVGKPPTFLVADMHDITRLFLPDEFDGIWASASLLHVEKSAVAQLLVDMVMISQPTAKIYIGLKEGEGEHNIEEDKHGKKAVREFSLWEKEEFLELATNAGMKLDRFNRREGSLFLGKPAQWLDFFFRVEK